MLFDEVLGWRFDDFSGWFSHVGLGLMNFSCSGFDEFFMF